MKLNQRINAFIELGKFFTAFSNDVDNSPKTEILKKIIHDDHIYNPWFTKDNIIKAIGALGKSLEENNIKNWLNNYSALTKDNKAKKVGVITAGNIPLVGFHDFLCVLISGNIFLGKLSSKDNRLLKFVADFLISIDEEFESCIFFTEDKLEKFDAVIATGSDNTSRYFESYFGKYPHIIRKNRTSAGIITGKESGEEIALLGDDIFSYFGLGCRNVSKLFVPADYSFDHFFENIQKCNEVYKHNKYANNYDYNKSIYLMNRVQVYDNGFLIVKEDKGLTSPIGVLFYEHYSRLNEVEKYINANKEKIQCIVSQNGMIKNTVPFGKSQQPELWDYADNVDTLEFLIDLK